MSQKKTRSLEYYSKDKGPKRTLVLECVDGKRYIKKRDLEKYYFQDGWTISDFNYHFGLGHRIVRGSLYKWFTKDQIDKSHRQKIAKRQQGDSNSNKCNWYIPKKLIPLEDLRKAVMTSSSKKEVKEKLQLTNYELSFLQQYYNFKLPHKDILINTGVHRRLTKSQVKLLAKTLEILGLGLTFFQNPLEGIRELDGLTWELRRISRSLKRAFRSEIQDSNLGGFPSNIIEYFFYKNLKRYYNKVIPQYYIPLLKYHCDFLLDSQLILELDGQFHQESKDAKRDSELESLGYKVVRIDLNACGFQRYFKTKDIRKCIKKYVFPKLHPSV